MSHGNWPNSVRSILWIIVIQLFFIIVLMVNAHAGVDFSGLGGKDYSMVAFPDISNTQDSVMWAHSHKTPEAIKSIENWMSNLAITISLNMQSGSKKALAQAKKDMDKWHNCKLMVEIMKDQAMGAVFYTRSEPI